MTNEQEKLLEIIKKQEEIMKLAKKAIEGKEIIRLKERNKELTEQIEGIKLIKKNLKRLVHCYEKRWGEKEKSDKDLQQEVNYFKKKLQDLGMTFNPSNQITEGDNE